MTKKQRRKLILKQWRNKRKENKIGQKIGKQEPNILEDIENEELEKIKVDEDDNEKNMTEYSNIEEGGEKMADNLKTKNTKQ